MPKCRIDWAQLGIFYLMFLLLHHFDPFYVHKIRFHKYVKFRIKYVVWAAKPKWPYACEQKASWFSVFGSLIRFAFFGNDVFFCNEWNSKQDKVKQSIGLNGPKSRMKSDEETHGNRQKKKSRKKTEHDKHTESLSLYCGHGHAYTQNAVIAFKRHGLFLSFGRTFLRLP